MKSRKVPSALTIIVVIILFIYYALTSNNSGSTPSTPQPLTPTVPRSVTPGSSGSLGQRTKTSGCVSVNAMPDSACTPGAIFPDATKDKICVPGYSSKVRNVPDSVKNNAYAEYGVVSHTPGQYEVDHLISLELGGSNDIANLWPEPADPRPGFHEKDKVENYLHDQVCSGSMSLQDAQIKIANDWFSVYQTLP
jgi:hypothetical protein